MFYDTSPLLCRRKLFWVVGACNLCLLCSGQIWGKKGQALFHFCFSKLEILYLKTEREKVRLGAQLRTLLRIDRRQSRRCLSSGLRHQNLVERVYNSPSVLYFSWNWRDHLATSAVSFRWGEPVSIWRQSLEGRCPIQVPTSKSWSRVPWEWLFSEA